MGSHLLGQLGAEVGELLAERKRPPAVLAAPERHAGHRAGRRLHYHPVVIDLTRPPHLAAEQERVALFRLEDILLVEFPDAGFSVREVDAEEPPVDYRAGVAQGQQPGAGKRIERPVDFVPVDACPQRPCQARWVFSRYEPEHALEARSFEVFIRVGRADQRVEIPDGPLLDRNGGNYLLGEDVEGVARDFYLLDIPFGYAACDLRRFEEVFLMRGVDLSDAWRTDAVAGAPDALEPLCHGAG